MKISSLVALLVTESVSAWLANPQNGKSSCPAASSPLFKKITTFPVNDPSVADDEPIATLVTSKLYTVLGATKEDLIQSAQNIHGSSLELQPICHWTPDPNLPLGETLEPEEYTVMTSSDKAMDDNAVMFGAWREKLELEEELRARGINNPHHVKHAIRVVEDILFLPITEFRIGNAGMKEGGLISVCANLYANVKQWATSHKIQRWGLCPPLKFNLNGFLDEYTIAQRETKEVIIVESGDVLENFLTKKGKPGMLPGATLLHVTFREVYKSDLKSLQLTGKEDLKKLDYHKGLWRTGSYEIDETGSASIRPDDESSNIGALRSIRRSDFSEIHFDNGDHVSYCITKWSHRQMKPLAFKVDRVNDPHGV